MKKFALVLVAGFVLACSMISCKNSAASSANDSISADSIVVVDSVDTIVVADTLVNE